MRKLDAFLFVIGAGLAGISLKMFYLTYESLRTGSCIVFSPVCFFDWSYLLGLAIAIMSVSFLRIMRTVW